MKIYNRTRIAYMAGSLITGKHIVALYDLNNMDHIEIGTLPDAARLKDFGHKYRGYARDENKYQCSYNCEKKHSINIAIKNNTFIGHITGSSAYFMGNVRGDSIYIYDREDSLHLNHRISG